MPVGVEAYLTNNITMVYEALPLNHLNHNKIRQIMGGRNLAVAEIPDAVVIVSQDKNIALEVAGRRIRVTDQGVDPRTSSELVSIAVQVHKLFPSSQLNAYGYNYDIVVNPETNSSSDLLKQIFLPHHEKIADVVQGNIQTIVPRLIFTRDDVQYDLILESVSDTSVKVHLNVHFDRNALPSRNLLQKGLIDNYRTLIDILNRFLENKS